MEDECVPSRGQTHASARQNDVSCHVENTHRDVGSRRKLVDDIRSSVDDRVWKDIESDRWVAAWIPTNSTIGIVFVIEKIAVIVETEPVPTPVFAGGQRRRAGIFHIHIVPKVIDRYRALGFGRGIFSVAIGTDSAIGIRSYPCIEMMHAQAGSPAKTGAVIHPVTSAASLAVIHTACESGRDVPCLGVTVQAVV
jgi:hypothetical protein